MKKLFQLLLLAAAGSVIWTSCGDDEAKSTWEAYAEWRQTNETWVAEQEALRNADGTPYYQKVVPSWNKDIYVLMHWFNDRAETAGNLSPMITSTVTAAYHGRMYNDEPFDSSAMFTTQLTGVIEGWQIALMNMRVGDSCKVVIPYIVGYGATGSGAIPPYSALQFNMGLKDVDAYEVRP